MIQPISWGPVIFNNRGSQNADNRDFVDAVYSRPVAGGELNWRMYYDSFHYQGRAEYALEYVGSTIEVTIFDRALNEATSGQHSLDWNKYLRIAFPIEPVGVRYIRAILLRMKCELAMGTAAIIAGFGSLRANPL
jgi:hypothetical protein